MSRGMMKKAINFLPNDITIFNSIAETVSTIICIFEEQLKKITFKRHN